MFVRKLNCRSLSYSKTNTILEAKGDVSEMWLETEHRNRINFSFTKCVQLELSNQKN